MRMKAGKRREALLQAALDAFATDGYEKATTRAIAEATGVTEAILFRHFATKRDLFHAVIERFGPAGILMPSGSDLRALPLPEAVRKLVADLLDAFWAHGGWLRVAWQESPQQDAVRAQLRNQFGAVRQAVKALLSERADLGEIRADRVEGAVVTINMSVRGFLRLAAYRNPPDWPAARDWFLNNLLPVLLDGIRSAPADGISAGSAGGRDPSPEPEHRTAL